MVIFISYSEMQTNSLTEYTPINEYEYDDIATVASLKPILTQNNPS